MGPRSEAAVFVCASILMAPVATFFTASKTVTCAPFLGS